MEKKKIYEAINKIMEGIGAISKDRTNDNQKYKFRGIDDVYNALQPALIKNKVFCVPTVKDKKREERKSTSGGNLIYTVLDVDYTFFSAEDGSEIVVSVCGEGMDSGDKSMNKAFSAAYKYACLQLFCIPTEGENHDSEEDSWKVMDRKIIPEEIQALKREAERTDMNLQNAMAIKGIQTIEDVPRTLYTSWMTTMALRDPVPPPTPEGEGITDIPDDIQEELPFK